MSITNHTPEPWRLTEPMPLYDEEEYNIEGGDSANPTMIAGVAGGLRFESHANAVLMVQSPRLLRVLISTLNALKETAGLLCEEVGVPIEEDGMDELPGDYKLVVIEAEDTIATVEGRLT